MFKEPLLPVGVSLSRAFAIWLCRSSVKAKEIAIRFRIHGQALTCDAEMCKNGVRFRGYAKV